MRFALLVLVLAACTVDGKPGPERPRAAPAADQMPEDVLAKYNSNRELDRSGQRPELIDLRFKDRPYVR